MLTPPSPTATLAAWIDHPCAYCGFPMQEERPTGPTRDHAIPKSKGGTLASWNRIICCSACNAEKGNFNLEEYWKFCMIEPDTLGDSDRIEAMIRERFSLQAYREFGMRMRGRRATKTTRTRIEVWAALGLEVPPIEPANPPTVVPPPYAGKLLNPLLSRSEVPSERARSLSAAAPHRGDQDGSTVSLDR